MLNKTPFKYLSCAAAVAAAYGLLMLIVGSGLLNRYQINQLIPIGYNIILAVSLNLAAGYLGQLPLGHAGFMAVGAYTSALFTLNTSLPGGIEFPISLVLGGLAAGVCGILIGLPALRLRGDYLAIITLGFGEIIRVIIRNLGFTGGATGLRGIDKYTSVTSVFIVIVIAIYVIKAIMNSRHGRAILSIREDEIAAESCGIPTTRYKVTAFAISAMFAGVAGGLYAHYIGILDPNNFGFMNSIEILVMVVLGGMGSMVGSVISASALTILPEALRGFEDYRMIAYSLLLVAVMIFRPKGLFGSRDFSFNRLLQKLFRRRSKEEHNG